MNSRTAERIFKAYRCGLLQGSPRVCHPGSNFNGLLGHVVQAHLPLDRRRALRRVWKPSIRGLGAAREGELETAAASFTEARTQMWQQGMVGDSRCLAVVVLEAAAAYLDFVHGDFATARRRTLESMDADLALESSHDDFSLLQIHRVQGAHNLMRVALREGKREEAFSLAGNLLAFLEGRVEAVQVHRDWRSSALLALPRELRRAMLVQIANEAALALARETEPGAWKVFLRAAVLEVPTPGPAVQAPVTLWLETRRAWLQEEEGAYLESLEEFLAQGRAGMAPLWYSAVVDFLAFCGRLGGRLADHVRNGILRDADRWPALPQALRPALVAVGGSGPAADEPGVGDRRRVASVGGISGGAYTTA